MTMLFYHDSINSTVTVLESDSLDRQQYGVNLDDWPGTYPEIFNRFGHGFGIWKDKSVRRLTDSEWMSVKEGKSILNEVK